MLFRSIDALKLGAQDFISKPFDIAEVRVAVEKALRTEKAKRRSSLQDPVWPAGRARKSPELVGRTPAMQKLYQVLEKVADSPTTVLITGESGSGKESFSKIIHHLSSRKHGPFTAINCGSIPEGTIDSELFGHEKGSFTGAHEARKG